MVDLTGDDDGDDVPSNPIKYVKTSETLPAVPGVTSGWKPFYLTTVRGIEAKDNQGCIGIRDIFNEEANNPIVSICLMNYMYDLNWLVDECPVLAKVPTFCLYGATPAGEASPTLKTVKVNMGTEQYGCHHSKIALVFYRSGVRVVVTTANFIPSDWHARTQGVYVQDFPRREPPTEFNSNSSSNSRCSSSSVCDSSTQFGRDLVEYLTAVRVFGGDSAMNRLRSVANSLAQFDFSSAEVVLVASVPGRHTDLKHKWGILKLAAELLLSAKLPSETTNSSRLAMQFSSVGSMGKNGRALSSLIDCMALHSGGDSTTPRPPVDLLWPSVDCVRMSLQGYQAGGSLPCARKNMYDPGSSPAQAQLLPCFRGRLREWDGSPAGRQRATPHMKCYFRYRSGAGGFIEMDWFLLTSSNLSQAAWGAQEKAGSQLHIRSYELGVLFLPSKVRTLGRVFSCTPRHSLLGMTLDTITSSECGSTSTSSTLTAAGSAYTGGPIRFVIDPTGGSLAARHGVPAAVCFPVPFRLPSPVYNLSIPGVSQPWIWDIAHPNPDIKLSWYQPG